ncbi:hypothetical protein PoB_000832700 [Plakobranchus ocellatus]|uniref:Uncharacterized protein n=1 Tax=Plakobranchus ocellatus TaxID=259542 RepID=A0AAV3YHB8_9GAST|nr:hypothetical protein PoB_000832700 [Plakobranchus ocellatus]
MRRRKRRMGISDRGGVTGTRRRGMGEEEEEKDREGTRDEEKEATNGNFRQRGSYGECVMNEILWRQDRGAVSTGANVSATFLRQAMQ